MSGAQNQTYAAECSSILSKIRGDEIIAKQLDLKEASFEAVTSESECRGGAIDGPLMLTGNKRNSDKKSAIESSEKRARGNEGLDSEEVADRSGEHNGILSKLLFLRQICSCPVSSIPPIEFRASESEKNEYINKILESSVKLRVF